MQLTSELRKAGDEELPRIARELQLQRVSFLILREVANDLADPTTYRELQLLAKLVEKADPEDLALRIQQDEEATAAAQRLNAVGLDPESASGMVRVLESLRQVMDQRHVPPAPTTTQR
ncbi:hypothetical protein BH24ACT15_BH24ACT15_33500 [soil metagenome]